MKGQRCTQVLFFAAASCAVFSFAASSWAQAATPLAVDVQLVTDESDAVLAILHKRKGGQAIPEADWRRLFSSEGYVRLKKRESELRRPIQDSDFRTFVLSAALARDAEALEETLTRWKRADIRGAAGRALAYLPEGARIRAKIYPVIKPQTNSFVFGVRTDPAIFLYLDPQKNEAQFENTLAHEMHHIGYTSSCVPRLTSAEFTQLPRNVRTVLEWVGAFGEGVAMLAAAGGPDVHPHAESPPEDRARWDRDLANFNDDLRKVEQFFLDSLGGRLTNEEEMRKIGFSLFGVQGPWYTVGWRMAVTTEEAYGRSKLIECLCDPQRFLFTYNQAAAKQNRSGATLALWSASFMQGIRQAGVPSSSQAPSPSKRR